jgi:hypothetical protein
MVQYCLAVRFGIQNGIVELMRCVYVLDFGVSKRNGLDQSYET